MTAIAAAFQRGAPPPTLDDLAQELKVPRRLAQQILETLSAVKLISEVAGSGQAYVPSRPVEAITCHDMLEALRAGQGSDLGMDRETLQREVYGEFQRIYEAEKQAAESISLLALANRANRLALEAGEPET
jgi:DNA-binding IscR family transcriptional regulator